jgi:GntR family transcriptional regulator
MARRIRYQEIAEELRSRAKVAAPGSMLPSEAEMSKEFEASRVTVRRALELVREDGLIAARQGFGWFVAVEPVRQRLESLGTIESQVEGVGKISERKVSEFAFEQAPARVRKFLKTDQVLRVKRVNLADGEPFAVVTV